MDRPDLPDDEPESEPISDMNDRLDETVVSLPCYEPTGGIVELTGRALCTHTLVLGQTGSGKTTSVLRWMIKDLIQHRAHETDQKPGLFIFDLNGDETVALVRKWAREAGREGDLRLLTPEEGHLELFADIHSLDDLSLATSLFMYGKWTHDRDNAYWQETTRMLLDAALSICLIVTGRMETETVLRFITNYLIAQRPTFEDEALLKSFELMASKAGEYLDKLSIGKIEMIRATIGMWAKLESRTKGILSSCLLDAVGGLISPETRRYLDPARGSCFVPEEISQGAILVFSLPAARKPEAASLLGKIVKSRLFTALQQRPQDRNQRLCAVVADEYHYLASGGMDRSSDVTALATLRSRSVAVIAASQSLDHLASVLGPHHFRSLLPNFGNQFFFRSTEGSTAVFANAVMGTRTVYVGAVEDRGDLLFQRPYIRTFEPVCPPGALAALEPGQAYVALSTGFRSHGAIWFAGNHEAGDPNPVSIPPHGQTDPWQKLREEALFPEARSSDKEDLPLEEIGPPQLPLHYDLYNWNRLLQNRRFQRTSFPSFHAFRQAFLDWGQDPTGLESLPPCWWEAVAGMSARFGHRHPMKLLGLHQEEGCLKVLFFGTAASPATYLSWITRLHHSIYPVRTRPIKRRDLRWLVADPAAVLIEPYDASEETEAD